MAGGATGGAEDGGAGGEKLPPAPCSSDGSSRTRLIPSADLAYTLPHWMNVVLKNTLGAPSAEMDRALTASVLGFLQNANVLKPSGECGDEVVDLRTIAMTKGH